MFNRQVDRDPAGEWVRRDADFFERLLAIVGHPLSAGDEVLDLGCGEGALVDELIVRGVEAHGADFPQELGKGNRLRAIEDPYRLPYPDGSFDFVLSAEVFEHVQDYPSTLREIRRVLRPGGVSIHTFPPRYVLTEGHTFVPLATLIQTRPWLLLWAKLGVRNQFQHGKAAREVATLNHRFLRNETTYYTRRRILRYAREVFPNARLLTTEIMAARRSKRAQRAYPIIKRMPALGTVYYETHRRVLLLSPS